MQQPTSTRRKPQSPVIQTPKTYSTGDVARLLGLSERTVQRLTAKGEIPGKLNLDVRNVKYIAAVVDEWLATQAGQQQTG